MADEKEALQKEQKRSLQLLKHYVKELYETGRPLRDASRTLLAQRLGQLGSREAPNLSGLADYRNPFRTKYGAGRGPLARNPNTPPPQPPLVGPPPAPPAIPFPMQPMPVPAPAPVPPTGYRPIPLPPPVPASNYIPAAPTPAPAPGSTAPTGPSGSTPGLDLLQNFLAQTLAKRLV